MRVLKQKSAIRNCKSAILVTALLFALSASVEAQQPGKIFRIGILDSGTVSGMAVLLDAFRHELSKLGWIEGKNIIIGYRFGEQKNERLPDLATDLVRLKVDLIVVAAQNTALAAKNATTAIPIVIASVADPVGAGLVASLARPGGNVTGLSNLATELNTKRLEVLKDAVPKLARVALLLPPRAGPTLQLKELRPAAVVLKLKLEEIETQLDPKGLGERFSNRKTEAGWRDYDAQQSPFFCRKKTDRRACQQTPAPRYLRK